MSNQTGGPFCPLYREALQASPWKNSSSAHAGLVFDKFADAWRHDADSTFAFDRGERSQKNHDKRANLEREGHWLKSEFPRRYVASERLLAEACSRQRKLVERLGGNVILMTNTERFVTGMGREHPLENGFAWHHTLGVPYLPGSSLKGMLRAWLRAETGEFTRDRRGNEIWNETDKLRRQFGTPKGAGKFIVLDMLPTTPPKLDVDVMTPHYGPYYQQGNIPGDWYSPVPISFLTVAPRQAWQLGIFPAGRVDALDQATMNTLRDALVAALEVCGAGAKTAVGYGRFERDFAAEEDFRQRHTKQQQQAEAARLRAAKEAEFRASMAGDSEQLQHLKKRQRDQKWILSAADQNMLSTLHEFADKNPQPPQDCLDWIRNLVESIPNYKGVWNLPEEKGGKKKDTPKYKSPKIRELVKKLNPHAR